MHYQSSKRVIDFISATVLLIVLSPIILLLCVLVRIFLGSPIIFKQMRPGLNEQPFYLLKFRTMINTTDDQGCLLSDEQRLTPFGKLLRSLSLDELPALINVIKGEMSLVGPRPLLMEYLPYYSCEQRLRHKVRPGITGWAQVNGRNQISWQEKFALDVWYVNHYSLWLDIKIFFLTLITITKREGINAIGHATMSRFDNESQRDGE